MIFASKLMIFHQKYGGFLWKPDFEIIQHWYCAWVFSTCKAHNFNQKLWFCINHVDLSDFVLWKHDVAIAHCWYCAWLFSQTGESNETHPYQTWWSHKRWKSLQKIWNSLKPVICASKIMIFHQKYGRCLWKPDFGIAQRWFCAQLFSIIGDPYEIHRKPTWQSH